MQKIRTFVAFKIPLQLLKFFEELLLEMRQYHPDVKWVKARSIHITLKFLGEITVDEIQTVIEGVEKAVNGFSKFILKTSDRGAFPSMKRPRVLWVGLKDENKDRLLQLQKSIEGELTQCGFPKEKRDFKPHLTVGRVRSSHGIQSVSKAFMEYPFPEIEIPIDEVLVMKSELTRQGAIYTVQKSFQLK